MNILLRIVQTLVSQEIIKFSSSSHNLVQDGIIYWNFNYASISVFVFSFGTGNIPCGEKVLVVVKLILGIG